MMGALLFVIGAKLAIVGAIVLGLLAATCLIRKGGVDLERGPPAKVSEDSSIHLLNSPGPYLIAKYVYDPKSPVQLSIAISRSGRACFRSRSSTAAFGKQCMSIRAVGSARKRAASNV